MNKILLSFGTKSYYLSLIKLGNSSIIGRVDRTILLTENDISPEFYIENLEHFKNPRGFGYWIWKAFFLERFLESGSDDDIFIYADAGNEIIGDLTPLYELCEKDPKGIILFDNRDGEPLGNIWKNNLWTKSDCFNLMGLTNEEYLHGNQINASYIVLRKTDFSLEFFSNFLKVCKNFNIISDAPNITNNFNTEFKDHRHDQSILSLLSIKYGITIMRDPSQSGNRAITAQSVYKQLFDHHRRKYL